MSTIGGIDLQTELRVSTKLSELDSSSPPIVQIKSFLPGQTTFSSTGFFFD